MRLQGARGLVVLVVVVLAAATVLAYGTAVWLPDHVKTSNQHAPFYLAASGRTYFVEVGDGDRDMWTSDGQTFYLYGTDQPWVFRQGDDLVDDTGAVMLHITYGGRVLVDPDNGWPEEAEQGYYESLMGPKQ